MPKTLSSLLKSAHDQFASRTCLVISADCPGHDFIADIVSKHFYESMVPLRGSECADQSITGSRFVGFTCDLLDSSHIKKILPIYVVRDSLHDSIMARVVANHFAKKTDENWESFIDRVAQPVQIKLEEVMKAMHQHTAWYRHYVCMIDSSSFVVSYDIASSMIANNSRIDLEKIANIRNLNEVREFLDSNLDEGTLTAVHEFYDIRRRIGSGDIYRFLQLQ